MARLTSILLSLISLLMMTGLGAAAVAAEPAASAREAPVVVFNRTVATFRASFLGTPPDDRARRTRQTLSELLGRAGAGEVSTHAEPQGMVIRLDGAFAMILLPEDADRLRGETLEAATARTVEALRQVVSETREGRDRMFLLRGLALAAAATVALALLTLAVLRVRRRLRAKAHALIGARADRLRIGDAQLLQPAKVAEVVGACITLSAWLLLLLLGYQWLSFVLERFPYTRPWGEQLQAYLLGVAYSLGTGVLGALPDLLVAVLIFMLARSAIGLVSPLFDRAGQHGGSLGWLDADTVRPTRAVFTIGVWLFAIVMAYPYLPGAGSEAFKGMSVLVGLMLTVGGASLVSQGASGLILMYSRTLRVGEYVRAADHEGTVTEMGMFTTRIRTGMGEEVTLPNALLLGTVTKNYSRSVVGRGYVVDTTLTIGYDTPWREVESMMLEAARRTTGVLAAPAPRVFQTALSDFYVEYRLVCQAVPGEPRPRAEVLTMLHQHLLDVFNERGVQIMSPHYISDPAEPKLVPRPAAGDAPARQDP
jgi:small-conductance mechanosensitive channel